MPRAGKNVKSGFDWNEIMERIPDLVLGLDPNDRIILFKGRETSVFGIPEDQALGLALEGLLSGFSSHRVVRDNGSGILKIVAEDPRLKVGTLEFDAVGHIPMEGGLHVYILRNQTEINFLKRFLDSYHDKVEKELSKMIEEKSDSLEQLTLALVNALENANFFNDTETGNHILRVNEYSGLLASSLGCNKEFVKKMRLYSSLHDIGKVGVSDAVLKKPGKYTEDEYLQMQQHVVIGARMLDHPEIDPVARNIVLYHHEKWDGTGYAQGLAGRNIPLEARIVAVADTYDALRSRRVYKDELPQEKTLAIILDGSGVFFDPAIVQVLTRNERKFNEINSQKR